jgi:hypothetical protein
VERGRAVGHGDGVGCSRDRRDLGLERGDPGSGREPLVTDGRSDGGDIVVIDPLMTVGNRAH